MDENTEAEDRQKNCLEKLTWRSEKEARAASVYASWQYGDSNVKPRPYRCKYCGNFHLART